MAAVRVGREQGQEGLHPMDHAPEVHAQHPVPVGRLHVGDPGAGAHARVVADHMRRPEPEPHLVGQGLDAVHRADVGHDADGPDLLRRRLQRGPLDIGDDHLHALSPEGLGDALADPRGASGDDRRLAGEVLQAAHARPSAAARKAASMAR